MAEDLGAKIIGLGAFTSVVGDKGITIARKLISRLRQGNSYTVATAIEGVKLAAGKMGHPVLDNSTLVVVGATGSIGRAVSLMMSRDVKHMILVARNIERLELLKEELQQVNPKLDVSYTLNVLARPFRKPSWLLAHPGQLKPLLIPPLYSPEQSSET